MLRLTLALVASFALVLSVRAADLPTGTWAANVDGNKGDFVVKEVKDGKFTGELLGADVSGVWDGKTLSFQTGKDIYEAHLVREPGEKGQTKYTLTGLKSQQMFNPNRAGGGNPIHVAKVGWYAQMTAATLDPTGEIKAEIRGTLVVDGGNIYISVKHKSKAGFSVEETRVWAYLSEGELKGQRDALAALNGKEVVITAKLGQMDSKQTSVPHGALYCLSGFEPKLAKAPK